MTNRIADTSQRKAARVAGFAYLVIIIAGIFAEFFVRSKRPRGRTPYEMGSVNIHCVSSMSIGEVETGKGRKNL